MDNGAPRIALLSAFDLAGGGSRAAYRLHEALHAGGVASKMVVMGKSSKDPAVLAGPGVWGRFASKFRSEIDQLPVRLYPDRQSLFSPAWLPGRAVARVNEVAADVVNVHWINAGFLRLESLARIQAPIVHTLHDMWAFTGG